MEFIDLKTQYKNLKPVIDERIQRVLDHGRYIMGPEVAELEERLAAFVGTRHCIGMGSGTDALMIAMMALGIGRDDEVITSPFTFIATAEMIALLGAKPIFVDIDPRTYNLDPDAIGAAITSRTRAIMPVALYGQCADMDAINAIAATHGLPVIEDAAQSFGATYKGRRSCALSTVGATSFFPSKPLGCYGDGGACFTDDDALARRMREIRVHGQDRRYHHPVLGVNGRLDTLQAAILLAKLDTYEDEIAARIRIGAAYGAKLTAELGEAVVVPHIESHSTSVYAQYSVQVDKRDLIAERLSTHGVPTAVHYPVPLHLQPVFADLGESVGSHPISERVASRILSLPMHPFLDDAQQSEIVQQLAAAIAAR